MTSAIKEEGARGQGGGGGIFLRHMSSEATATCTEVLRPWKQLDIDC